MSLKGSMEPPFQGNVVDLLLLGDVILALTSEAKLIMWNTKSLEQVGEMKLEGLNFTAGGVLIHPDTYLNKVCAFLQLFNFPTWLIGLCLCVCFRCYHHHHLSCIYRS